MATIKKEYQIPEKIFCDHCGAEISRIVFYEGDGWTFGYAEYCDYCWKDRTTRDDPDLPWPFEEDNATVDDWEMAGFVCL